MKIGKATPTTSVRQRISFLRNVVLILAVISLLYLLRPPPPPAPQEEGQPLNKNVPLWKNVKPLLKKGEEGVCNRIFDELNQQERPLYKTENWMLLRQAYERTVGVENSRISPITPGSGVLIPFEVRQTPHAGRGVFATQNIPKGTMVYSSKNEAVFENRRDYTNFLDSLPADMACDVLMFWKARSDGLIYVGTDEGVLFNTAETKQEHNVGCPPYHDCEWADYAMRDIRKGEQLLEWYAGKWPRKENEE